MMVMVVMEKNIMLINCDTAGESTNLLLWLFLRPVTRSLQLLLAKSCQDQNDDQNHDHDHDGDQDDDHDHDEDGVGGGGNANEY